MLLRTPTFSFFFFNDTATTEIYTLSLHDALPISLYDHKTRATAVPPTTRSIQPALSAWPTARPRSEEHTSELQSQSNLVCRLLLEKKKKEQRDISKTAKHSQHMLSVDSLTTMLSA